MRFRMAETEEIRSAASETYQAATNDSVDAGHGTSDAYYDPYCELCDISKKRNAQAKAFCKTCYQCLCSECLLFHNNLQGTRGHAVVQGDDMPRSMADKPPRFEDCEAHPNHVKDQFCFEHQILLCSLCATANHTSCTALDVESACNNISSSEINSIYDTVRNFTENIKTVETSVEINIEQLKVEKDDTFKDAQDMYQKVLSKFNGMHEKFKQETEEKYKLQHNKLMKHQTQLKDQTARLELSLSDIDRIKGKTVDAKVFLKMQDVLNETKEANHEIENISRNIQTVSLSMKPNKQLQGFLTSPLSLCSVTISTTELKPVRSLSMPDIKFPALTPLKTASPSQQSGRSEGKGASVSSVVQQLTHKDKKPSKVGIYNAKMDDDRMDRYWITGIAVTKNGRKLFADFDNKKVKMFSRDMRFLSSLSVPAQPWDVVVTDDQEAVVGTLDRKLLRLQISAKTLTVKQTIDLNFKPYGITKYGDKFIVTSEHTTPPSVNMIDVTGKVLWTLSTDKQGQPLFQFPWYVNSCGDGETSSVIVADSGNNTLTSVRVRNGVRGEVVARRQVWKLPHGMTSDSNGNIYVCYRLSGEIALVNEDLSEEKIVLSRNDGLDIGPQAIAFDESTHQVIISYWRDNNFIQIYQL